MNFQFAGTVSDNVKTMALEMKWQERKQNLFIPKEENSMIADMKKRLAEMEKSNKISSIDAKLKAGKRLSASEMDFLRKNVPELYKKAVQIEKEREEYRRALENCRTKEDVARLNMSRMQQFLTEAKAISSNPNIPEAKKQELLEFIAMRVMATMSEHTEFINSPEYQALPSELDDDEKDDDEQKAAPEINERIDDPESKFNFDDNLFSEILAKISENNNNKREADSEVTGHIYSPEGEFSFNVSDDLSSEISVTV